MRRSSAGKRDGPCPTQVEQTIRIVEGFEQYGLDRLIPESCIR
ncbi:MAG: hypothetical protein ACYC55_07270 [Candidatus Geothermincolia bacterium]